VREAGQRVEKVQVDLEADIESPAAFGSLADKLRGALDTRRK
jgi:hypothetical protein